MQSSFSVLSGYQLLARIWPTRICAGLQQVSDSCCRLHIETAAEDIRACDVPLAAALLMFEMDLVRTMKKIQGGKNQLQPHTLIFRWPLPVQLYCKGELRADWAPDAECGAEDACFDALMALVAALLGPDRLAGAHCCSSCNDTPRV